MLEFAICAVHGIRIDRDLSDDLADGWRSITGHQPTAIHGVNNLLNNLSERRYSAARVEAKSDTRRLPLHVLVRYHPTVLVLNGHRNGRIESLDGHTAMTCTRASTVVYAAMAFSLTVVYTFLTLTFHSTAAYASSTSSSQAKMITVADQILIRNCMKAAGFEYWVVRNPLEPPEIEFPFGIDNMAWAKSNGFGRELTTRISTNELNRDGNPGE